MGAACNTARDHVLYHRYPSEEGAIKSLRRRCKGFTAEEYRRALGRAVELWSVVEEVIAPFGPPRSAAGEGGWGDSEGAVRALEQRCPGFPPETYDQVIGYHLYYRWR